MTLKCKAGLPSGGLCLAVAEMYDVGGVALERCSMHAPEATDPPTEVLKPPAVTAAELDRAMSDAYAEGHEDAGDDPYRHERRELAELAAAAAELPIGSRAWMAALMRDMLGAVQDIHAKAQKEYARADSNAFANFDRVAELIGSTPERVLLTYWYKHVDGILAYVLDGHEAQREPIRGRFEDAIAYLCLLFGLIERKRLTAETQRDRADRGVVQGEGDAR